MSLILQKGAAMVKILTRRQHAVATAVGVLAVFEAVVFFLGALLHLGVQIPVGFGVVMEPRILPAAIVEGLIGLFCTVSAYAVLAHRSWAWMAAIVAHAGAVAGILLGMIALAIGAGPRTELNDIYHRVMLLVAVTALILLLTPSAKAALGRRN
jgi:hypothetical protein